MSTPIHHPFEENQYRRYLREIEEEDAYEYDYEREQRFLEHSPARERALWATTRPAPANTVPTPPGSRRREHVPLSLRAPHHRSLVSADRADSKHGVDGPEGVPAFFGPEPNLSEEETAA